MGTGPHALLSIFLSAMLDEVFRDMGDNVYIQFRQGADLFNVAQFRAKIKTIRILMRELLFVNDSALVRHSAEEMQKIMDVFSDASNKFGLKLNIKQAEVLYQTNSTRTREEDIIVDGNKLNYVLEFTYLSADYARDNHHESMLVKSKIYRILSGAERTGLPSMEDLLIGNNFRWTGHTSWRCQNTRYQRMFSTLNCLQVTEREGALVSCSRIPPRETWSWET